MGREPAPDQARLQAAAARPRASAGGQDAYPDVHLKAAALFHAIARDHPFPDGNKRTAVLATFAFYGLNGWWVEATQDEVIDLAVGAAVGELSVEDVAKRLGEWATPMTEERR